MQWIYMVLLVSVLVYLLTIDFKPNHIEFLVIIGILLFILSNLVRMTEFFEEEQNNEQIYDYPERLKLYDIPEYASKRIGGELDKLIKDAAPKEEDKQSTEEVFSKDNLTDDTDLLDAEKKVDDSKFAMFRREYKNVNAMLLKIKEEYPDVYARIFPA